MAINLQKGQRINLEKNGSRLEKFCVGCNWGAIVNETKGFLGFGSKKIVKSIDLDLSCIVLDAQGKLIDYIYSPDYKREFLASHGCGPGKLDALDEALHHSGDDRKGDEGGDDGLDNEIIAVDLARIGPAAMQIFFFLNNVGNEDFSAIPYASIRMYEGTPQRVGQVFAAYDVAAMPEYRGQRALIMGKLYRRSADWRFAAIGDACADAHICDTIDRIIRDYSK